MFSKSLTLALLFGAVSANKAQDIARGIIKGAAQVEIDQQCLSDIQMVIGDAETVVQDFSEGTLQGAIDGVKEVIQTVSDVQTTIGDCTGSGQAKTKLAEIVAVMKNAKSFEYHVGKDIMVNGKDIRSEIVEAIKDYKSGDFYNFGVQIGEATAKTVIGQEKRVAAAEFLEGMTNAYGGHFNLEALLACIGEEDKAALILDAGIQAIERAIQTQDYQELIPAAIALFAAFQQARQGWPACQAVDPKVFAKIDTDITKMSTSVNLLEFNHTDYIKEIEQVIADYKNKDFVKMGQDVVTIIEQLVNKQETTYKVQPAKQEKISRKDITSFVQGFFEATNVGHFNFTILLECIYAADQAAEVADVVYHLAEEAIEDRSIQEAIPAVIGTVALVQAVKQALPVCEAVDTKTANWTTYNKIINTVEAPEKFMKAVNHEIVANGKTVTKEIGQFLNAMRSGDFYTSGLDLGMVLSNTCDAQSSLFLY